MPVWYASGIQQLFVLLSTPFDLSTYDFESRRPESKQDIIERREWVTGDRDSRAT
jgi:hypothetical protein